MPIRPENRHRYTKAAGWPEIRRQVLAWDGNCCAFCGVPNHAKVNRSESFADPRWVVIVLTVAHLDHSTDHSDPANLRALCQRCHNRHDRDQRQENVARTRRARRCAGQQAIEGVA